MQDKLMECSDDITLILSGLKIHFCCLARCYSMLTYFMQFEKFFRPSDPRLVSSRLVQTVS